jgi:hypothetical protein
MRCLEGAELVKTSECVRERVRIAGGASSSATGCVAEDELDERRARQRGEICGGGGVIEGEGTVLVTSKNVGNKSFCAV